MWFQLLLASLALAQALPTLSMNARQQSAVHAAASHYRSQPVEVLVEPGAPAAYQTFAAAFVRVLRAAGLDAEVRPGRMDSAQCPRRAGLRVAYSPELSGAANAIAEALVQSNAVVTSVGGCTIGVEGALRFLVAGDDRGPDGGADPGN